MLGDVRVLLDHPAQIARQRGLSGGDTGCVAGRPGGFVGLHPDDHIEFAAHRRLARADALDDQEIELTGQLDGPSRPRCSQAGGR